METLKADEFNEEEFRSMTPFEQQRYTKKVQKLNRSFRDILQSLKEKSEKQINGLDEQGLSEHKEQFEDHLSLWRHHISLQKGTKSREKLSERLEREIEHHVNKYMELYSSTLEELRSEKKTYDLDEDKEPEPEPESDAEPKDEVTCKGELRIENRFEELEKT